MHPLQRRKLPMIYAKTELGQRLFKARDPVLTPRQRSAFILFDGVRPLDEVLLATTALGITQADVRHMLEAGLLAPVNPVAPQAVSGASSQPPEPFEEGESAVDISLSLLPQDSARTERQRFNDAYPVAVALTASLGLRGFRLNLAVEAAGNYQALLAVAPRIREAVGASRYQALERALLG